MKRSLILLALLVSVFANAQAQGIHFEHGLNWEQIKAKAKAENKSIFIDCYTTWCGPCRMMSQNIFPQQEAGDFFNEKFINVKVQMDTSKNDSDTVKRWYADANRMMGEYRINSFPTFLFFNPNGELVHRIVGADNDVKDFVNLASDALDPNKQLYTRIKKFQQGNRDTAFLKSTIFAAINADDKHDAKIIFDAYYQQEKDVFTKDNLEFLASFMKTSHDSGFEMFLNNKEKVDAALGAGADDEIVFPIIAKEGLYTKIYNDGTEPNWTVLKAGMLKKYPTMGPQIGKATEAAKVNFYQSKGRWDLFVPAATSYVNQYSETLAPEQLNGVAAMFFANCTNQKDLNNALGWSKLSLKGPNALKHLDTYANLLYKLGRKDEAIQCEQKIIDVIDDAQKPIYTATLGKMQKGEKTW